MKAKDLKPGQVIRIEYGAHGNWAKFQIETVILFASMVTVCCLEGEIKHEFSWSPEEDVEVVS